MRTQDILFLIFLFAALAVGVIVIWVNGQEQAITNTGEYPIDDSGYQENELEVPQGEVVQLQQPKDVTILDSPASIEISTMAQTVGEAITDAGVKIQDADIVEPSLGSGLEGDEVITIRRASPVSILVDGFLIKSLTHQKDAVDILTENDISLIGQDFIRFDGDGKLEAGDTIEVVRVTNEFELVEETIPFDSVLQANSELELDQISLASAGVPGLKVRRMLKRYENGIEATRLPVGDWVAKDPVDEVTSYGTKIVVRSLETPEGSIEYWRKVSMQVTSYTAASTGKSRDHPTYGVTASGLPAGTGVVAIDPSIVPFKSKIYVPGYGIAIAGDTGGGIKGRIIDLGYDEGELVSWRGFVDVYYLTPVPPPDKINYLIP